jgi:FlaA1/EpsC-like NDP-sugar epimerase
VRLADASVTLDQRALPSDNEPMPRSAAVRAHRAASAPIHSNQRVVLIGTPESIAQAREQLALANAADPLGCILVGPRQARAGGGLPVLGTLEQLDSALSNQNISLAIVSLPLAMADTISQIRASLRCAGVQERFLPCLQDLLTQAPPLAIGLAAPAVSPGAPSRLDIAELIGRSSHTLDRESIARTLTGKRVLITGAGGSIGAELARIVAEFEPEQVQLVERAENPLFEIDRQIGRRFPGVSRRAVLHDVVDSEQTLRLLVDLKPHVVFHAAAHKHVPLMEDHPSHAVTNNLFGTKSIADAALATGVERFVMVSTDKAVNPTSVMGATKRLAELYIQWLHESSRRVSGQAATRFSMVRFGNVLGSACSVLTIWSAQLADGGPITVTDPRMTRFFMTIPEAAALVIQAGAIDHPATDPAAVHVLEMGEPLRILDVARRFVRAHGFEARIVGWPEGAEKEPTAPAGGLPTIDIVFTGIRPGEKLYEELSYGAEQLRPTPYGGIRAWAGATSTPNCAAMIADLSSVRTSRHRESVLSAIRRHIPEMR